MDVYEKYHLLLKWSNLNIIDWKCINHFEVSIFEFNLEPLKSIAPNYMMEPSVT
jgi:hypothetical protein